MTRFGTSHFVSHAHAVSYYRPYAPDLNYRERRAWIESKVRDGEIHIGRPECKPGESIVTIDDGTRYAIEAPDLGDKAPAVAAPAI